MRTSHHDAARSHGSEQVFDAVVVGGGPAGSVCARALVAGGLRVALLDRARFPRVKLCAGWVSAPFWDAIELAPADYPRGLWPWRRCHVHFAGVDRTVSARGHFIRRYELDDFLLRRAGAEVIEGHRVDRIERAGGEWQVDGRFRARYLVGAGGTHCPVARRLFPARPDQPVGVQEIELAADPREVAATRAGDDGEPELLLHADLSGYSWNVPKSDWLNLGCGVDEPRAVRAAWTAARAHFADCGHLPPSAAAALDQPRGYTYHLFRPERFDRCHRDGAFLVGDALGLAHPLTAEGIAPAAWSGRLCAEAILAGAPASYGRRLAAHPLLADYARVHRLRELASALRRLAPTARGPGRAAPGPLVAASRRAIAGGFAWMFAGKPIPAGRALDPLAWVLERGLGSPLARALAARSRSPGDTPC